LLSRNLAAFALAVVGLGAAQQPAQPTVFVDAVVIDDAGRPVTTLKPSEFRVTVDKEPRQVESIRYVFRGPGAVTSASLADPAREAPAAAEHGRLVLVVVDETSIQPGQEKPVVAATARILDELAAGDRATVITLPLPRNRTEASTDAPSRAATLAKVRGRATEQDANASRAAEEVKALQEAREQAAAAALGDPDDPSRAAERQQAALQAVRTPRADDADPEARQEHRGTARALQPIVEGFRAVPGLKTVIVVRQADAFDAGDADRQKSVDALIEAAVRSRTVIHLVAVGGTNRKMSSAAEGLRQAAVGSGGTFTALGQPKDARAYDALRSALWGGYLIEVAAPGGVGKDGLHALRVTTTLGGASVRTAQWWVPRNDPVPEVVSRTSAPAAAPSAPAPAAPPAAGKHAKRARADDPQLTILVARMNEYLSAYLRDFANVVAEEETVQEISRGWRSGPRTRHLKSEILLVKTSDATGWLQYRDVFEVDGRAVRDREARVQKLFLEDPAKAPEKAEEISDESARYNLGDLKRTMNVPTLALMLLSPSSVGGVSFERDGEDTINGLRTARIKFEETGRPTLVRQIETGGDAPSSGTVWIDPSTGRIVRTLFQVEVAQSSATMTVTYKPADSAGIWVPAEMYEVYRQPGYEVNGRASYSNFRSFNVTTDVKIAK
jgi:VWFA-related protein